MKRYFVLAAALLLAACQVPIGSGGTLKVVLPNAGSRASMVGDTAVRLQLTRNNIVVPLSGGDYIEKSLSGQTVSIDGLVPGSGYVLLVSTGSRSGSETFYRTNLFQKSASFEISAGTDTAVTVTLDTSPVEVVEATNNSTHSATAIGNKLYYLNGTDVYQYNDLSASTTSAAGSIDSANVGSTVNSLSNDGAKLWLNTANGIWAESSLGGGFPSSEGSGSIIDSGKATIGSNSFSYYYGDGLTAGLMTGSDSSWSTIDDLISLSTDLKNKLKGQIIQSVATTSGFGVISTAIGAFRLDSAMVSGATASQLGDDINSGTNDGTVSGTSIVIQPSDTSVFIGPVSAIVNSTTYMIFGGTSKGLFASATTVDGVPPGGKALPLVEGTAGLNITKLATYRNVVNDATAGTVAYTAAYSANTREILVLQGTTVVNRIPAFAGLPSGDLRLTFCQDASASGLYLVVTGSDATVKIKIASLNSAA